MNNETLGQDFENKVEASKIESSKLAEAMPVDPGELNICISCE